MFARLLLLGYLVASSYSLQTCTTDEDCSLNGVCRRSSGTCVCDRGWTGASCGSLDLRPAKRHGGYNLTSKGTSSWGSTIIQDPHDRHLYHLFAAEFANGCGLDYWAPYSRIIRAESRNGPTGPYEFAAEIQGTFAHNPTVVYSPADREWLMYYIGCEQAVAATCTAKTFTCGPGNNNNNGESGISVMSSKDLRHWERHGPVFRGDNSNNWDADVTNPSPLPLYSEDCHGRSHGGHDNPHAMLLVYRGCPYNCTTSSGDTGDTSERINVAVSLTGYKGPYTKVQANPIFENVNEDPFVWRDKRGNYHMLLHSLEPKGGFGDGPNVGRHAFARHYSGPWTFGSKSLAFTTHVDYSDGSSIDFNRRERPQLYFSDDGEMTPLLLTTGVQEVDSPMSYSVIVPVGVDGVRLQH